MQKYKHIHATIRNVIHTKKNRLLFNGKMLPYGMALA